MTEVEEKQLPAPASLFSMMQRTETTKATEKIEMQRATAEVFAAHQRAIQYPRDEERCFEKIQKLCKNIHFAADAISAKPNRGEVLKVQTMKSIALIWGNIDSGTINHGVYETETQGEAWAVDLESNYKSTSRFTVSHYKKANGQLNLKTDPEDLDIMFKAQASKEVRNQIKSVIPDYIYDFVLLECKRTMHEEVKNVSEAWAGWVKLYEKLGVTPASMMRWINKTKSDQITAAEIVDLRILYSTSKSDLSALDAAFPERDKSKTAKAAETQQQQKAAIEPPKSQKAKDKERRTDATATAPSVASVGPTPSTSTAETAVQNAESTDTQSAPVPSPEQGKEEEAKPADPKPEEPSLQEQDSASDASAFENTTQETIAENAEPSSSDTESTNQEETEDDRPIAPPPPVATEPPKRVRLFGK